MRFRQLSDTDWTLFATWAAAEGWRVPDYEQRLLRSLWRSRFFALIDNGRCCGFISAVAYPDSGWLGNLLVARNRRGRGYGTALFEFALAELGAQQCRRLWLTASQQGAPLYSRHGFSTCDRVERWTAPGLGLEPPIPELPLSTLLEGDTACWGESRAALLMQLAETGTVIGSDNSPALLQADSEAWQLGPWLARNGRPADPRRILEQARRMTPADKTLCVDILASTALAPHLRDCGFSCCGTTRLMCLSSASPALKGVLALASLGSLG